MDDTWTIRQLAERAAAVLAADEPPRANGRVRDVPNERLVRWYTTIGLLDPPLGRRGRVALYGRRHLLQLVAVKRRQAQGRSIAEIQVELAAATDATLAAVAGIEDGAPEPRERFWAARPDVSSRVPAVLAESAPAPAAGPAPVRGVRLAPGLTLLLDDADLDRDDLDAIAHAAGPLLRELRRRGLLAPDPAAPSEPSTSDHPAGRAQ
ncbi:MerR family transcriptional regulator [Actinomadura atramentaria]|uniref:MerR family transcriptional regulator n=1 Tax=Actinomadura atramentaria TaxID=1990 RepID=UPI00036C49C9|nr:MerR family transcriptional regulator [Actinomadura atramentaria]